MAEDELMIEDNAIALDDTSDSVLYDSDVVKLVDYVHSQFKKSEDAREKDEDRWLRAYRNYRGMYGPDVQFTEAEKSRVFIKITNTKTLAAYGQIVDVLFGGSKFPISIEPTQLPEGVAENVSFDPKVPADLPTSSPDSSPYGFAGDGMNFPKGATATTLQEKLGPLQEKLQAVDNLQEGSSDGPVIMTKDKASEEMIRNNTLLTQPYDNATTSGEGGSGGIWTVPDTGSRLPSGVGGFTYDFTRKEKTY